MARLGQTVAVVNKSGKIVSNVSSLRVKITFYPLFRANLLINRAKALLASSKKPSPSMASARPRSRPNATLNKKSDEHDATLTNSHSTITIPALHLDNGRNLPIDIMAIDRQDDQPQTEASQTLTMLPKHPMTQRLHLFLLHTHDTNYHADTPTESWSLPPPPDMHTPALIADPTPSYTRKQKTPIRPWLMATFPSQIQRSRHGVLETTPPRKSSCARRCQT